MASGTRLAKRMHPDPDPKIPGSSSNSNTKRRNNEQVSYPKDPWFGGRGGDGIFLQAKHVQSMPGPARSKRMMISPSIGGGGGGGVGVGSYQGDKDYIYLNTRGICILCYDECDPITNEEKKKVNIQTTINFCRLISRYLNFNMEDVIAHPLTSVGRKRRGSWGEGEDDENDGIGNSRKKYDKVAFELCERCVGLAHAFNQVHFQVQFHQMILDRCVRSISDIVRKANKKSVSELFVLSEDDEAMKRQEKTFTRLSLGGLRSANRFRNKLLKKSILKLSQAFPILKLKKTDLFSKRPSSASSGSPGRISLRNKMDLRQGKIKNGTMALVPFSMSGGHLRPPKNSKEEAQMFLASYLGCIVSFWIVISLSFINLDELVINYKKEKKGLVELKVERDIGIDYVSDSDRKASNNSFRMPPPPPPPTKGRKSKNAASLALAIRPPDVESSPKKRKYTRKIKVDEAEPLPDPEWMDKEPEKKRKGRPKQIKTEDGKEKTTSVTKAITPSPTMMYPPPLSLDVVPTPSSSSSASSSPTPTPKKTAKPRSRKKKEAVQDNPVVDPQSTVTPMASSINSSTDLTLNSQNQLPNAEGSTPVSHSQPLESLKALAGGGSSSTAHTSWNSTTTPTTPLISSSSSEPSGQQQQPLVSQPQQQYYSSQPPHSNQYAQHAFPTPPHEAPSMSPLTYQPYSYQQPQAVQTQYITAPSQTPAQTYYTEPAGTVIPPTPSYSTNTSSSSSSSSYYTPPAPEAVPVPIAQSPQRRLSYNGSNNMEPYNSNVNGSNYNYSYNFTTYNYSNNAPTSYSTGGSAWVNPHQNPAASTTIASTSSTSTFSAISDGSSTLSHNATPGTVPTYVAYEGYGQQAQNQTLEPSGSMGGNCSTANGAPTSVGLYEYDGYGNYVLQQQHNFQGTSNYTQPSTFDQPTSTAPQPADPSASQYYNYNNYPAASSSLPPISTVIPSTATYKLDELEPPNNNSSPSLHEETPPSLTYEEPPPQLHDFEVEEQYLQLEAEGGDVDGEGSDGEGSSARPANAKSLSIFPEVHWRQAQQHGQSAEKQLTCSHTTCKEKFITNAQLQLHLRSHGAFKCSFCQISFGKAHNLALHEKLKHSTKTGRGAKCPRCDYHMTPSIYKFLLHFLYDHLKISVHDKPCEVCNKPFIFGTKSINRKLHFKKYHDVQGKDPTSVKSCKGCNAPFLKETQLKDHIGHCAAAVAAVASSSVQELQQSQNVRAPSVSSTVSTTSTVVTTVDEITFNTAVATAEQIMT